ncbi:MAG: hypothetical protein CMA66_00885 [Euryarchaeota archaeon]|jgi:hypothetical protein|nr:hypothetical protein [Euryarchaeota archaeon]|tara:strand:- start:4614 stop:5030 length:417 start_codon:yes stop_codon:yes gene_type:complete
MLGLVEKLINPVSSILDKVIEDKDQKAKLAHEIATMSEKLAAENAALQAQANVEAAKHPSLFVAGARPAILWCCTLGLFLNFFVMPIADWVVAVWYPDVVLFELDTGSLMTLTLSLLGVSGLRSFEKSKGVARENMKK